MNPCIAVYTDQDHALCNFAEAERIIIYRKDDNWDEETSFPIVHTASAHLADLRQDILTIIEQVGDCRIIVGGSLTGAAFSLFDRAGFQIFGILAVDDETFDGILQDIAGGDALRRMREEIIKNARPVETETDGIYYLDLIALQTECPEVSSKKALMDFLENTPFLELHLVCRHLPPWLENGAYKIQQEKRKDGTVFAVIMKNRAS